METNDFRLIQDALKQSDEALSRRLTAIEDDITGLHQKTTGAGAFAAKAENATATERRFESVGGKQVKYYGRDEQLSKGYRTASETEDFSLGEWVRNVALGTKAASSTATVPTGVSGSIIDMVRAKTVVVEAGAGTIVIDGPMNAARLTGDATVHEHDEAVEDVVESDITFSAAELNPKTLIATVPLTLELVADSPNLDDLLMTSLSGAFGSKLDSLALAAILADAAIPSSSVSQNCATWAGTMAAITEALGADQALPTALIGNTADFTARASEQASTAGTWLGAPPALSAMLDLYTTALTAGTAVFGQFDQALAIVLRQQLTLELIRFGKPGSGSHLLVAHMRAGPAVLQPGKLFVQKTTVA